MDANMMECPKCGYRVEVSSKECIKCGIIFSKYFEVKERVLRETLSDLDRSVLEETAAAGEHSETEAEKKKVQAELEKAAAKRRKIEAQEKSLSVSRDAEQQEKARRDAEKAQLLKKRQEILAKAESRVKKKAEKEKQAPPPQKSVEKKPMAAADQAGLQRIARLEKEAETLKLQTAALQKEKQAYEKADLIKRERLGQERQEVLKKEQEAQKTIAALEEKILALGKEAETLIKDKEELALEASRRKAQDEKEAEQRRRQEKEAQEKAAALELERQDARKRIKTILKTVLPKPTMKELLEKYEGEAIGINFDDPAEIKGARLAKVNEDHFSIMDPENELVHSYPYSDILSIVEGAEGVPIDTSDEKPTFPVVIRVMHLMVKKKWGFI